MSLARRRPLGLWGMWSARGEWGAERGWAFNRHEYEPEEQLVRDELERARAAGLLEEGVWPAEPLRLGAPDPPAHWHAHA